MCQKLKFFARAHAHPSDEIETIERWREREIENLLSQLHAFFLIRKMKIKHFDWATLRDGMNGERKETVKTNSVHSRCDERGYGELNGMRVNEMDVNNRTENTAANERKRWEWARGEHERKMMTK